MATWHKAPIPLGAIFSNIFHYVCGNCDWWILHSALFWMVTLSVAWVHFRFYLEYSYCSFLLNMLNMSMHVNYFCITSLSYSLVSTCMGDHQGRQGTVNLGPFVGASLILWPTFYIPAIVLTQTYNKQNETNDKIPTSWLTALCIVFR